MTLDNWPFGWECQGDARIRCCIYLARTSGYRPTRKREIGLTDPPLSLIADPANKGLRCLGKSLPEITDFFRLFTTHILKFNLHSGNPNLTIFWLHNRLVMLIVTGLGRFAVGHTRRNIVAVTGISNSETPYLVTC